MATPSVPLSALVTKDVSYEWHDGVALVSQLLDQLRPAGASPAPSTIPDPGSIALEADGRLTIFSDAGPALPAMPGAAQVLQQLLSGTGQPPQLRLFVMQVATSEPPVPLNVFAGELSKWERPNRVPKLIALHARALATIGSAALSEEAFARQKLQASRVPRRTETGWTTSALRTTIARTRTFAASALIGGAIVVAAGIVAALEWRYVLGRSTSPAPTAQVAVADDTLQPDSPLAPAVLSLPAARSSVSRPDPSLAPTPQEAPSAPSGAAADLTNAQELSNREDYATAREAFERLLASLGNGASARPEEIRQTSRSLDEVAHVPVEAAPVDLALEYHSGDPGVVAPVPEAYLPPKPDPRVPPEQLQVMELRINTDGRVDSAKFVTNRPPTYRNAWWPAAAKSWRFKPAMKDGKAVRYVMRIVLDDSDVSWRPPESLREAPGAAGLALHN